VGDDTLPVWTAAAIPAAAERLSQQVVRLEQSADLTEVATDLAGLLWAEREDLPLIATILEEPAARAALEAVAEARRCAGRRLAEGVASFTATTGSQAAAPQPGPGRSARWAALLTDDGKPSGAVTGPNAPDLAAAPAAPDAILAAQPSAALVVHPAAATGAAVAGVAATAILLFGRRLRRA